MINIRDLTKVYQDKKRGMVVAVDHLSFEANNGEIFGLLGHNGAGKSTTIGMMLGQVWPTSGEVKVCGHDVTTHRAKALHSVGAIFEAPAFYDISAAGGIWKSSATTRRLRPRNAFAKSWIGSG